MGMKRKAIKFAGTYVVSLPLPWIRRFGIEKNRDLELEETGEGSLEIFPERRRVEEEISIKITKEMDADIIYYKVLRAYITGFKKIILTGVNQKEQFNVIGIIHKKFTGLEVTDQTEDSITLTDMLRMEDVSLDKMMSQQFSLLEIMGSDIISYIEDGKELGDSILEKDAVLDRVNNLAYRSCNLALRDSRYLRDMKKDINQVLAIARILRNLEFLGNLLIGVSYLTNTKMSRGMEKYHYPLFEKSKIMDKIILDYLKKWLSYFKNIRKAVVKMDPDTAAELYIQRFAEKLDAEKYKVPYNKHFNFILTFAEQINRNTSSIVRDMILF